MVDLIDKEKILRLLDEADDIVSALYRQGANKDYKCKSLREKLKAIAAEINSPTIEDKPVRLGRWIPTEYDSYADGAPVWDKWECSECGHEHSGEEDTLTAFCPDCGAKMDVINTNVDNKGNTNNDSFKNGG